MQQQPQQSLILIGDLLIPFCEASSIHVKDVSRSVRKRILASVSFADIAQVHDRLFKRQHIDWTGLQDYLQEVVFTPQDWMHIIRLLDFVQEVSASAETSELLSTAFAGLRLSSAQTKGLTPLDSLRLCFAKVKVTPSWDLLCKTFVLCNLSDVDSLTALLLLLGETQQALGAEQAKDLVRYVGSYKHTRAEYTDMFSLLLDEIHCQVRSHVVLQSLKQREALKDSRRQHAISSGAAFRKPSLTQLLETKLLTEGANHPQDSFRSFCRESKIASNVNVRVKQVAYYLVCLPDHPEKEKHLVRTLGGDGLILSCVQSMRIMLPDVQELRRIIMETHYTLPPTDTLRLFKERCISSCLITAGKRSVHWSTVMRLYLAAYTRPEISKDLWSFVLHNEAQGTLLRTSPETDSMVQSFTKSHPMALGEAVDAMLATE